MIGSLVFGSLALQTVLVIGGPQDGNKTTYNPIIHVSHIDKSSGKKGVQVQRKSSKPKNGARRGQAAQKSGVRILDASARRRSRKLDRSRIPTLDVALTGTRTQLAQSLTTAKERQVALPILRQLEKADWHLARGAHQGRTNLRAQAELGLAIQAFGAVNNQAHNALRREQSESPLGRKLARMRALADEGTTRTCIALTRLQLKKGDPKGAERWIQKASKVAPTGPEVLVLKAKVDRILGKE